MCEETECSGENLHEIIHRFLAEIEEFLRKECVAELSTDDIKEEIAKIEPLLRPVLSRWTPEIVYALYLRGRMSFNELKRAFGVSSRVLSDKLKFLEKYGIVFKEIDLASRPIRVYYSLTDLGKEIGLALVPLLVVIKEICIRRKVS